MLDHFAVGHVADVDLSLPIKERQALAALARLSGQGWAEPPFKAAEGRAGAGLPDRR